MRKRNKNEPTGKSEESDKLDHGHEKKGRERKGREDGPEEAE